MPLQTLAIFFLGMLAAGGLAYVFIYPILSGERQAEKRQAVVARPEPGSRLPAATRGGAPKSRRDQVEESLKELELRQKNVAKPPLSLRIQQAGLDWTKRQFFLVSAGTGLGFILIGLLGGLGILVSLLLGFAGAFGFPRWLLSFLKKRRQSKFLSNFPDAVDVIVRGIKAGLPLGDCIRIIATEGPEPVRTEFRSIVETQSIGMPLGDACAKLHERMYLPEANFFGIVVAIQSKSGGNLSEALGNLSRVLRDRKRMAAKIQAMSMEAKASAVIIAALPFAVMILVYITSPSYIELLWTTPMGRMMMAACVVWMLIGTMVMKKMINFDF